MFASQVSFSCQSQINLDSNSFFFPQSNENGYTCVLVQVNFQIQCGKRKFGN